MTEFPITEIDEAARTGRLLALEVELDPTGDERDASSDERSEAGPGGKLSRRELEKALTEARELGVRQVSFVEGSWVIEPHLDELLAHLGGLGMKVEVHVGEALPSEDVCAVLARARASVVVPLHGTSDATHDRIAGRRGHAVEIRRLLESLRERDAEIPLAIRTSLCRSNVHEAEALWSWARHHEIAPYFENAARAHGDTTDTSGLDPASLEQLFHRLAETDRREFGREWDPQPPWPGRRDLRHRYACRLTASGALQPPGGLPIEMGNVREQTLAAIVDESEVLEDLRLPEPLKGPCRECDKIHHCGGSRSEAYASTGDYLASDPECWRNRDRRDEIRRLPFPVGEILPQRPPMQFVDTLVAIGDRTGECELTVHDGLPFVTDGRLDEAAFLEIIAQTMAALQSFKDLDRPEQGTGGFLVGAESLEVREAAHTGDVLRIQIRKETRFGQFGIVGGVVRRGSDLLAEGRIKIWREMP